MRLMTSQKVKKATNQKECCNTTPAQQHSLCVKDKKILSIVFMLKPTFPAAII